MIPEISKRRIGGAGRLFIGIAAGTFLFWGLFTVPTAFERHCFDCLLWHSHNPASYDRGFSALKTVASAQADLRCNDRDGNGVQEFWRGDISGLYGLVPPGSTEMIKLIEISVAAADAAPWGNLLLGSQGPGEIYRNVYAVPAPKAGYWYLALRHADEISGALDSQRFAACAYPADYQKGRKTFILSEGNTIFMRDLGRPGPPKVFPDPESLKREWSKLD